MAIDPTLARGVQQAQIAPNLISGFGLGQAIADEPTRKKQLGLGLREDQRNDKRSRIQDMQNTAIAAYQVLGDNFDVSSLNVDNIDGTIDKLNSFVEIESSGDRGQDVQALINMYQGGKNLSQAAMAASGGGQTKFQFGQSYVQSVTEKNEETGEDESVNYLITQRRNPTTGEVGTVRSRVDGSLADSLGRTRKGVILDKAAEAKAKAQASADVEFANFQEMANLKLSAARDMAVVEDDLARADGLMDQASATENQIIYIDEAIEALNEGANTGWFVSKLPTFRASTIALEQAIKKLGIENINKATFGALSEKELELALSIDVDKRMSEKKLKEYLGKKKDAMRKLATEQRKLARHIRQGGTIETWRDLQSSKDKNKGDRDELSTVPQSSQSVTVTSQEDSDLNARAAKLGI